MSKVTGFIVTTILILLMGCQEEPVQAQRGGTDTTTVEICEFQKAGKIYDVRNCDYVEFLPGGTSQQANGEKIRDDGGDEWTEEDLKDDDEWTDDDEEGEDDDWDEEDEDEDETEEEEANLRATYNDGIGDLLDSDCVSCHDGSNELSDLSNYGDAADAAQDALSWVVSGDMPRGSSAWDDAKIAYFQEWVDDGTPR